MADRIFRKQKMLDRLAREGRSEQVGPEELRIMDLLDGKSGTDYNWESVVKDEPFVLIHLDKYGAFYVNIADCD